MSGRAAVWQESGHDVSARPDTMQPDLVRRDPVRRDPILRDPDGPAEEGDADAEISPDDAPGDIPGDDEAHGSAPTGKGLEQLIRETPGLWRGRDHGGTRSGGTRSGGTPVRAFDTDAGVERRAAHVFDTGYPALDDLLPTGGWPRRAVIEIVVAAWGSGELQPFLPLMTRLTAAGSRVALVAPPFQPYAPALVQAGVTLAKLLVVAPGQEPEEADTGAVVERRERDAWWAAEKLLCQGDAALVLLWPGQRATFRAQRVRRLQLAADRAGGIGVILGLGPAVDSPVGLRLRVARRAGAVHVALVKSRYGWCGGESVALPPWRPGT